MEWYLKVLRQYADFNGRARRKEYWMFTLVSVIISIVLLILDNALGLKVANIGVLGGLYSLAVLLPALGVSIRRLHDTGRSGWWLLALVPIFVFEALALVLVPSVTRPEPGLFLLFGLGAFIGLAGVIVLIVFYALEGNRGHNRYGPDPKTTAEGNPATAPF